jgi:hypothetical protein
MRRTCIDDSPSVVWLSATVTEQKSRIVMMPSYAAARCISVIGAAEVDMCFILKIRGYRDDDVHVLA